jgi:translocation and assembly module TamB
VARSGTGLIRARGTFDLAQLTRPGLDLTVTAEDAEVLDNEHGRLRADLDLAIAGPFEQVRITGDVAVQRGVIYVPDPANTRRTTNLDAPTMVSVLDTMDVAEELRRLPPPILRNLQADVGITVARDTWLRSPTANVEIYTPEDGEPVRLTIDNSAQAIILEGTINADRGEYSLAGRQFELTTGSITFLGLPDPDPLLQLSAQYQVPRRNREALIININVGGYLSEPRITLSSNAQPPLPESDLISYLAFGRSSTSLLDQGGSGITGSELGFLAEQQLAGLGLGAFVDASVAGLEEQGAEAGLDVFRVRPAPLPDELNIGGYFQNLLRGMEVEAGKYLTPRFFLSAQGRTSGDLPGLRLEWQNPNGFSWHALWESGYLPQQPSLGDVQATQTRVFGAFLLWSRRW